MTSDYPLRFINMVINEFEKGKDHGDKSFIIPSICLELTGLFISWPLAICLASGPGPGPKFVFTDPWPQFVFTAPGLIFLFTDPGLQFSLPFWSLNLPFSPLLPLQICIYWTWPTICITSSGSELAFTFLLVVVPVVVVILAVVVISLE